MPSQTPAIIGLGKANLRTHPGEERGLVGETAHRGTPAPIQVGRRWVVERANSWLNDFGRLKKLAVGCHQGS
ncbi:putative transposase [Blastococcus saxobsidens DD2]|uniref:Putative transposase n=1 Tax=Blastococcus saxobsidens (strain DD2) TaxID=1146883 RepID=H6RU72_BLASD|nr:putative transposase [Blastococcus saxobsidens DD2]